MASNAYALDMTSTEEAGLIRKVLDGRRDLFANLIAPHLAPLLRVVKRNLARHQDAEDIVQQAAFKALTHLEQFRFEASFRTWLLTIGVNEARQWRRKFATSFLPLDLLTSAQVPIADERQSPLAEYQRNEAAARLHAAAARLPGKYRTIFLLRELEQLSLAEVAQRLGLTVPAVKTRQMRARKRLALLLKQRSRSRLGNRACR